MLGVECCDDLFSTRFDVVSCGAEGNCLFHVFTCALGRSLPSDVSTEKNNYSNRMRQDFASYVKHHCYIKGGARKYDGVFLDTGGVSLAVASAIIKRDGEAMENSYVVALATMLEVRVNLWYQVLEADKKKNVLIEQGGCPDVSGQLVNVLFMVKLDGIGTYKLLIATDEGCATLCIPLHMCTSVCFEFIGSVWCVYYKLFELLF